MENNKPQVRFKGFNEDLQPIQLGNISVIGDINHRMPPTVSDGIPYLMTGDFIGLNELDFETAKLISVEQYDQLSKKIKPEFGDILFARYASIGDVRYVETNKKFLISYSCAIIKKSDSIFEKYLYFYLQNNQIQNQIELEINTGSQRNIGIDSIRKLTFQLPKETEQQKISTFFENLDKLITEHQQKHAKLKALKKALLSKMFPQQGQSVPEIRFKGFTDDWESKNFEDILSYERPDNYIVKSSEYSNKFKTPVLTANKGFVLGYTNETNTYEKPCIIFDDFTLDCKLVEFPFMVKSSALKILTVQNHNSEDLHFMFYRLVNKKIEKMGHARHYISVVQKTKVLIPHIEEQLKIAKYLYELDKLIGLHKKEFEKSNNIKKAFLAKMFI